MNLTSQVDVETAETSHTIFNCLNSALLLIHYDFSFSFERILFEINVIISSTFQLILPLMTKTIDDDNNKVKKQHLDWG